MRVLVLSLACLRFASATGGDLKAVDQPFDKYGLITWEAEKARLDNFAIQLTHANNLIGYIVFYDGNNVCVGEAEARANRAKRYIAGHRGIPSSRVIVRNDGYTQQFGIVLQPIDRSVSTRYPVPGPLTTESIDHVKSNCKKRVAKIKQSK
jgi:hypothetical protein